MQVLCMTSVIPVFFLQTSFIWAHFHTHTHILSLRPPLSSLYLSVPFLSVHTSPLSITHTHTHTHTHTLIHTHTLTHPQANSLWIHPSPLPISQSAFLLVHTKMASIFII